MTKLQQQRTSKQLTQKRLSELSGIPLRTIQQWECQQRDIDGASIDRLCDLAITVDCKIYDLLENADLIEKLKKCI